MKQIMVKKGKEVLFPVVEEVFELLFDHTIARRRAPYLKALANGAINVENFYELTRTAKVPYPLFLAPLDFVKGVIEEYEKLVFYGASKKQISLAARGDVELSDISLLIRDITRKQAFMGKQIKTLNRLPGKYKKDKRAVEVVAAEVRALIGYDVERVITHRSKEQTFNYLRDLLADHHIYLSVYAHNFCPQNIDKKLKFSGIALKDKKCPYIFIRTSEENSAIEPWGRRIFTAVLLLFYLMNGQYGPLTMDGRARELINDRQYRLAEEFLMPANMLRSEPFSRLEEVVGIANRYSVSPSAATMRLFRLGKIDEDTKKSYLDLLFDSFDKVISERAGGNQIGLEKAITRYNNPELVRSVIIAYEAGLLAERDAKNLLYYKKGDSFDIATLKGST